MNKEEKVKLVCKKCEAKYEKPKDFVKWNKERPNVFFKWSLEFCDNCRREKERDALKNLPNIIKNLSKHFES